MSIRAQASCQPTLRAVLSIVIAALSLIASPASGRAQPLQLPTGKVVLTVSGAISRTNAGGVANFDMKMLEALPNTTVTTATAWTDGPQTFDGVKLIDLLTYLRAKNMSVMAYALNDYSVAIPEEDLHATTVLIAYRRNGQYMSIASKGPLWIIYPDSLGSKDVQSRMIWQLRTLEVGPE
ncbi:molybdopterin-dependent oxidoreductase [Dongia soli]|uniref:Molybdopterin-dependent oxidoreductase n=1 Tax=Dongia soli TaxID=600628 RepID=A0ABU5EB27_9PROT|nr:molybdopterin-dependent oxidoreductase [Dongia soli]MDY0883573.1 molybdopterin-dependent oxidoreductase [Dongia soli]